MDDDRRLQRIRRVGLASVLLTVAALIWAVAASYWLIWLIALSFASSTFVLLGEYRKAKAARRSAGPDENGVRY